jgi:ATP-dependent RNA circularization protein (DNA/RNA ligase family)
MLYNISNFKEKVKTMSVESHEICTKYPRTYHLYWSKGVGSDDKIKKDLSNFEGKVVVVTEKLDGENTTMYPRYDLTGMHARSFDGAFDWTREWVRSVQIAIVEMIKGYRVCGENMTAIHSITYDDLVSFFYIFSIWDEETNMCLSWEDTVAFAEKLDIPTPKVLYHGIWDEELFKQMFEDMDTEKMEGYTIRLADSFHYDDFSNCLVKAVREGHVQTDEHWRKDAQPASLSTDKRIMPSFMDKTK